MSVLLTSPRLLHFYKAWLDWATNGATEDQPFRREHGLCLNLAGFYSNGAPAELAEMTNQFEAVLGSFSVTPLELLTIYLDTTSGSCISALRGFSG